MIKKAARKTGQPVDYAKSALGAKNKRCLTPRAAYCQFVDLTIHRF